MVFGLSIFSIPTFSFAPTLYVITWILTAFLLGLILIDLFFFGNFTITVGVVFTFLFIPLSLLSSLLSLGRISTFTSIFLVLVSLFLYEFASQNRAIAHSLLWSAYLGICGFLFVFVFVYRKPLFSLDFFRLGGLFGDENDIAICLGVGMLISLFQLFFTNHWWKRALLAMLLLSFSFCGISTGSKMFLLVFFVSWVVVLLFVFRKKWYLFILSILVFLLIFILLLRLPFMSVIRERLDAFLSSLLGETIVNGQSGDLSTKVRYVMFFAGLDLFLQRPLIGFGNDGFWLFNGVYECWSHNHFSDSLANFGLFGTICYHGLFCQGVVSGIKHISNQHSRLSLLLLAFFFSCMFGVALHSQKIYAYLLGPIVALAGRGQSVSFRLFHSGERKSLS